MKNTITLGEICTIEKGKIGIQAAVPGEYPLITTAEARGSHNEFHFEGEAVCIPLVSATGHGHASIKRLHYEKGKFSVGNILAACIPKNPKKTSAKFLYLYLSLFKDSILVPLMQGSANVSLKIKDIEKVEVPNIDITEQLNLVDLIDRLKVHQDGLYKELGIQQSYLQQLRQSILQEAVQGELTQRHPDDEPASKLLERIKAEKQQLIAARKLKKEKPLPPITADEIPFKLPDGWVWCRLGEVVNDFLGGFAFKSTDLKKEGKNQVLRLGNIKKDKALLTANPVYIDDRIASLAYSNELCIGDILITMTGTRLKRDYCFTLLLNESDFNGKKLFLNQRVGCLRLNKEVHLDFVNIALKADNILDNIFKEETGTANQGNIGVSTIKNCLFPIPPISEQQRIVTKVHQLMQMVNHLELQVQQSQTQAQQLLQAVLKEAFSPKPKLYAENEMITMAAEE